MFNFKSKMRLLFSVFYLLMAVLIAFDAEYIRPYWLKEFSILLMLFCIYICMVKSNILKDKNAKDIKNESFDFISIIILLYVLYKLFKQLF